MFITGKHLDRRTVLKGLGVTLALPLLDAMVPAGAFARNAASSAKMRLIAMEMVHGAAGSTTFGQKKNMWSPADAGSAFDLSPTAWRRSNRIAITSRSSATPIAGMPRPSCRPKSAAITSGRRRYS